MSWQTPKTWVPGEMATPAKMNQHVRDNLLVLKDAVTNCGAPKLAIASVGNSPQYNATGTGQTTLTNFSFTIPANLLSQPGHGILIWALGYSNLSGAGTRTLYLTVGGTQITLWTGTTASVYLIPFYGIIRRRTSTTGSYTGHAAVNMAPYFRSGGLGTSIDFTAGVSVTFQAQFSGSTANTIGILDMTTTVLNDGTGALVP